jgi:uracil-DNA glycosylase
MPVPLSATLRLSLLNSRIPFQPTSPLYRTMGVQKRINSFFVNTANKKSKATEEENGAPSTVDPSKNEASGSGAGTSAAAPSGSAPTAAGTSAAGPSTTALATGSQDLHSKQVSEMQSMRSQANKNCALAKQVVIKAENAGTVPLLTDLLIEPTWRQLLGDELSKPYFNSLQTFVQSEWNGGKLIFPPKDSIFRAFNSCPVNKVRVVILGQDPYHDLGQAQGLSFSVPQGKKLPSSLRNIYKELKDDLNCPVASHGSLEKWSHQGVLLLNAVLTVRAHQAASHAKKGWETFTSQAIAKLSREQEGIVFILWGKYAQDKGKVIDTTKHFIVACPHPSGLSAHRGFFGSKCFSKCNDLLEKNGKLPWPIDWCID